MSVQPTEGERNHALSLKNRRALALTGITDVVSFDEGGVVLNTALGALTIEGEGLHLTKLLLESGEVNLEGKISALYYSDRTEKTKTGLLKRLMG